MSSHKTLINNLAKETQILESLDWDEDLLKQLYEFLDIHFSGDSIITPDVLLKEVKENFGNECCRILRELFIEVSINNGLHIYDPNIEN